jgi:membrane protease YdiL (CAAX protease family)
VFEVLLAVAIAVAWRRLDLGDPAAWGFRRAGWWHELARGLAIGLAGVLAGLAVAWLAGGIVPALRFDPVKTVQKAVLGLLAALLVGVGEETLFRGILLRRFVLDCGPRGGLLLTTSVYAVVHALRGGGRIEATGLAAGWERTAGLFAPLGDPTVWPGVVGLFGLGLVLAAARRRTGALWLPIGIHAAWVGVFRVGRLFVDIRQRPAWAVGPGWPPLVGGVAGGVALFLTALLVRRALGDSARRLPP